MEKSNFALSCSSIYNLLRLTLVRVEFTVGLKPGPWKLELNIPRTFAHYTPDSKDDAIDVKLVRQTFSTRILIEPTSMKFRMKFI